MNALSAADALEWEPLLQTRGHLGVTVCYRKRRKTYALLVTFSRVVVHQLGFTKRTDVRTAVARGHGLLQIKPAPTSPTRTQAPDINGRVTVSIPLALGDMPHASEPCAYTITDGVLTLQLPAWATKVLQETHHGD